MPLPARGPRWKAILDGISATRVAVVSLARGLALLPSGRPGTPLRALCIAAFDTLHVLRHGKRLPPPRLRVLAALVDFGACLNAEFDRKAGRRPERRAALRRLEEAGLGPAVADYLRRLGDLEGGRPRPGGDGRRFQKVSTYREAVVRLSLRVVAAAACGNPGLDGAAEGTYSEGDLELLFRIVMQCQIIDDVLDQAHDRSAGLPSFLTACESLPQALELTRRAARGYAGDRRVARPAGVWPLRAALFLVSTCTGMVVWLRRRRCRTPPGPRSGRRTDEPGPMAGASSRLGRHPRGGVYREGTSRAGDIDGGPG